MILNKKGRNDYEKKSQWFAIQIIINNLEFIKYHKIDNIMNSEMIVMITNLK